MLTLQKKLENSVVDHVPAKGILPVAALTLRRFTLASARARCRSHKHTPADMRPTRQMKRTTMNPRSLGRAFCSKLLLALLLAIMPLVLPATASDLPTPPTQPAQGPGGEERPYRSV